MQNNKYKIYSLIDPNTKIIRYIGFTTQELNRRLHRHLKVTKRCKNTHKINWIKSLLKKNQIPIIRLMRITNKAEWQHWEKFYIYKYRALNYPLTNITDGGESVFKNGIHYWKNRKHTKRTKLKMSRSRLASITPSIRISISNSNSKRLGKLNPRSTPIQAIRISTGKTLKFISYRDAELRMKEMGYSLKRNAISKHVNGKCKNNTYKGFKWKKINIK